MTNISIAINPEIIKNLSERAVGKFVLMAIQRLFDMDSYLLEVDANERTIAARLAIHLQYELPDWSVDCEYNRDGVDPKRLSHLALYPDSEDTDAKTVFPDIIVHQRGSNSNLLVIEIKKSTSTIDRDIDRKKLVGYMRQLGYENALYLEFVTADAPNVKTVEWVNQ